MSEEHELHNTLVACDACGREQAEDQMLIEDGLVFCDVNCQNEFEEREEE